MSWIRYHLYIMFVYIALYNFVCIYMHLYVFTCTCVYIHHFSVYTSALGCYLYRLISCMVGGLHAGSYWAKTVKFHQVVFPHRPQPHPPPTFFSNFKFKFTLFSCHEMHSASETIAPMSLCSTVCRISYLTYPL